MFPARTGNKRDERTGCSSGGSKARDRSEIGICSGRIDMNQRIDSKVLLEPGGIGVFRSLVYGEGDRSHQGNACHWRGNSSKETSELLGFIGVPHAIEEAVVLVGLHSRLHRVQGELIELSGGAGRGAA